MSALLLLIYAVFLYLLRKNFVFERVVVLYVGVNFLIALIAVVAYDVLELYSSVRLSFYDLGLTKDEFIYSLVKFFAANVLVLLGAIFYLHVFVRNVTRSSLVGEFDRLAVRRTSSNIVYFVSFVAALIISLSVGFLNLIYRNEYLIVEFPPLFAAGQVLTLLSMFLLGRNLVDNGAIQHRAFTLFLFFLIMGIYFSLATRLFALGPVLFLMGARLNSNNTFWRTVGVVVFFAPVILLLQGVPLMLRSEVYHGLLPYLNAIIYVSDFSLLPDDFVEQFALNFSFGVPLLEATVASAQFTWSDLLISINPLPGVVVGWYDISPYLRINDFVPFSMYGEVYSLSVLAAFFIFLFIGFILGYLACAYNELNAKGYKMISILVLVLIVGFAVMASQYNTRNSTRMLYYALILNLSVVLYDRVRPKRS